MGPDDILYLGQSAISLIWYLSLPVIGAALAVGLLVALLQTLIQLQEQTLAFAAKLAAIIAVLVVSGDWISSEMLMFQNLVLDRVAAHR